MEPVDDSGDVDYYEIEMTEFKQQVLPDSVNKRTKLCGYGGIYPAATIEARDAHLEDLDNVPEPDPDDYLMPGTTRNATPKNRVKKDTVLVNPNEVLRIEPAFTGYTGHFVWHCHILEHEDQEMMLPFVVQS